MAIGAGPCACDKAKHQAWFGRKLCGLTDFLVFYLLADPREA